MIELKPCPFCGSDDISAFTVAPQSFVYCRICKALGFYALLRGGL